MKILKKITIRRTIYFTAFLLAMGAFFLTGKTVYAVTTIDGLVEVLQTLVDGFIEFVNGIVKIVELLMGV